MLKLYFFSRIHKNLNLSKHSFINGLQMTLETMRRKTKILKKLITQVQLRD